MTKTTGVSELLFKLCCYKLTATDCVAAMTNVQNVHFQNVPPLPVSPVYTQPLFDENNPNHMTCGCCHSKLGVYVVGGIQLAYSFAILIWASVAVSNAQNIDGLSLGILDPVFYIAVAMSVISIITAGMAVAGNIFLIGGLFIPQLVLQVVGIIMLGIGVVIAIIVAAAVGVMVNIISDSGDVYGDATDVENLAVGLGVGLLCAFVIGFCLQIWFFVMFIKGYKYVNEKVRFKRHPPAPVTTYFVPPTTYQMPTQPQMVYQPPPYQYQPVQMQMQVPVGQKPYEIQSPINPAYQPYQQPQNQQPDQMEMKIDHQSNQSIGVSSPVQQQYQNQQLVQTETPMDQKSIEESIPVHPQHHNQQLVQTETPMDQKSIEESIPVHPQHHNQQLVQTETPMDQKSIEESIPVHPQHHNQQLVQTETPMDMPSTGAPIQKVDDQP